MSHKPIILSAEVLAAYRTAGDLTAGAAVEAAELGKLGDPLLSEVWARMLRESCLPPSKALIRACWRVGDIYGVAEKPVVAAYHQEAYAAWCRRLAQLWQLGAVKVPDLLDIQVSNQALTERVARMVAEMEAEDG